MRKRNSLIKAMLATALVCVGMNGLMVANAKETKKDEIIISVGGEESTGYDSCTGWGRRCNPLIQSKLYAYTPQGEMIEDLATGYEVSEDGMVWTFTIRDDVYFTDGEQLTAEDVAFTYNNTKEISSAVDLSMMEKAEAIDDFTVQMTLVTPQSTFLYQTTSLGIVPEHAYNSNYGEHPIGSGPFKLVEWDKGQQMILERNDDYYGQKPSFSRLVMLFLEMDAAYAAVQSGSVDIAFVDENLALQTVEGYHLVAEETVDNRGVCFPTVPSGKETSDGHPVGNDVTADVAIRKAICYGVDREVMANNVLNGYGTPIYSICDKLEWFNENTILPAEECTQENAIAILEEGGWVDTDNDGIREKDGLKAEFTLIYPATDSTRQAIAFAVAEQAKPLGINIITEGHSWDEMYYEWYCKPAIRGGGSFTPIELYNSFSSNLIETGTFNPGSYSNSTVDAHMADAMAATDYDEMIQAWKDAQWDGTTGLSMIGDAPTAWMINIQKLYFVRDGLNIGEDAVLYHGAGNQILNTIFDWCWE